MRGRFVLSALVGLLTCVGAVRAEDAPDPAALARTLGGDGAEAERVEAGLALGRKDPNLLADTLDELVKKKRAEDLPVLVGMAVQTKVPHVRLLLVHQASRLDGAADAFRSRIDNDKPYESARAIEALGFLRDAGAMEKLLLVARGENELMGVAAARAIARVAGKRDVDAIVETAVEIDNSHVRQHLAWALKDVLKSAKSAHDKFARLERKGGTTGFRAKEAAAVLDDDDFAPQKYKEKLESIEGYFGSRVAAKPPPIDGPADVVPEVRKAFELLKEQAPDWYHLICASVKDILISGNEWVFELNKRTMNLRLRDVANWKDGSGGLRHDVVAYYAIRFATIMFLQQMGDPSDGHRGWEEGIKTAWWYAIDHTQMAVAEDLQAFLTGELEASPPPW